MKKDIDLNDNQNLEAVKDINFPAYSAGRKVATAIAGLVDQAGRWIRAKVDAHCQRLISLRVYDQRRN